MTSLSEAPVASGVERATRVRYGVVAMAILLAAVTYLDRVCISKLAPEIMDEDTGLGLSEYQMSIVFTVFNLAYAIFEIPTARWAYRRGTRRVLTRIVAWWSTFTIATAGAFNYVSLLAIRFLFGAGEAGAWPCVAASFSKWIPAKERGTVQGIFFAGAHLSGGLTPWLVWLLTYHHVPWRTIFMLFGLVGFVWAVAWFLWYRDDPGEDPRVNQAERELILRGRTAEVPHKASWQYWRRLVAHRNTWPLCLMYVGNTFCFYFCITWFPTYLEKQHDLAAWLLGLAAGLPLTLSVAGDLVGGVTSDRLARRFGLWIGRSGLGLVAYGLAAVAMFVAASSTQAWVCVPFLSLAVAATMFTLGAAWATCLDIGGSHAGVVSATMNTAGNAAAMVVPSLTIFLKDHFGTWNAPLYMISGVLLLGTICWGLIDPRKRVFE